MTATISSIPCSCGITCSHAGAHAMPYTRRCLDRTKLKYRSHTRQCVADQKTASNKCHDEYYTRGGTYARLIRELKLEGQSVVEPFGGDGSYKRMMKCLGVKPVGMTGNFWDKHTKIPAGFILSNPPFSSKWEVLETLLEQRRDMALVMPFQSFYNAGEKKLNELQSIYGGVWSRFDLRGYERWFYNAKTGEDTEIGCQILIWRFTRQH